MDVGRLTSRLLLIMLIAQAGSLGLILSLFVGFLRRVVARPERAASVSSIRAGSTFDRTPPVTRNGPDKLGSTRSDQVDLEFSAPPSPDV